MNQVSEPTISEINYKNRGDDKGSDIFPKNRTFFPLKKMSLEKYSWPLVLTQSEDQYHALIMMIMILVMTNLDRDTQYNQEIDHDHNDF